MSTSENQTEARFTMVVGLDFTEAGGFAFDHAARVARRVPGARATIHLVHVFDAEHSEPRRARDLAEHLELYAGEKAAAFGGLPGVPIGVHLREGNVARELVQLATEAEAALLVLGARKGLPIHGWRSASTTSRVMASAPCPVLLAGPRPKPAEVLEPALEPPCDDCVNARFASRGERWWCDRHSKRGNRAHTFSYRREIPFATHDSAVTPTGTD